MPNRPRMQTGAGVRDIKNRMCSEYFQAYEEKIKNTLLLLLNKQPSLKSAIPDLSEVLFNLYETLMIIS